MTEKTGMNKFMVNLVAFIVLILINILPIVIFEYEVLKAWMALDISRMVSLLEDINFLIFVLIALNGAFAFFVLTKEQFKTNTTKYWAYMAILDCLWWIYTLVG